MRWRLQGAARSIAPARDRSIRPDGEGVDISSRDRPERLVGNVEDSRILGRRGPPVENIRPVRPMAPAVEGPVLVQCKRVKGPRGDIFEWAASRRVEEAGERAVRRGPVVPAPGRERSGRFSDSATPNIVREFVAEAASDDKAGSTEATITRSRHRRC